MSLMSLNLAGSTLKIHLYHAGELVEEFKPGWFDMTQYTHTNWGLRVYNEGYIHGPVNPSNGSPWYRPNRTPVRIEDVPKEYLVLALLFQGIT